MFEFFLTQRLAEINAKERRVLIGAISFFVLKIWDAPGL